MILVFSFTSRPLYPVKKYLDTYGKRRWVRHGTGIAPAGSKFGDVQFEIKITAIFKLKNC